MIVRLAMRLGLAGWLATRRQTLSTELLGTTIENRQTVTSVLIPFIVLADGHMISAKNMADVSWFRKQKPAYIFARRLKPHHPLRPIIIPNMNR